MSATIPTKPRALRVHPDGIPASLRSIPHWINWAFEFRDAAWTKTPKHPRTPGNASVTDRSTWATFEQAFNASGKVGFVLSDEDDLLFLDLDDAYDMGTGELADWAIPLINMFADRTYVEISPSGTGFKIIGRGHMPKKKHLKQMPSGGRLEVFETRKYTALTGHRFAGARDEIDDCQDLLDALYAEYWPDEDPVAPPSVASRGKHRLSDSELIEVAQNATNGAKFSRLYFDGDTREYDNDESRADLGLLCQLAFYTTDPGQLERVFGRSALGEREKWTKRADYRERCITRALDLTQEHYTPHREPMLAGLSVEEFLRRRMNGHAKADVPPPEPPKDEPDEPDEPETPKSFALTDVGNAERFVDQHRADVRHCPSWGTWLTWDAGRMARDETGDAHRRSIRTVRAIYTEAEAEADRKRRAAIASHAIRSESASRIDAMLKLASKMAGIAVMPDELDRDPWLFNVENGVLDLRTGTLQPHDRRDLMTKLAPVVYDLDAECPRFLSFLGSVLHGNQELIGFLQRAVGYSLTGVTSERVLFILYGEGLNGKSTFLEAVRSIFGDYETRTPTDTLLTKRDNSIPNDIARLKGARFVTASEADEGRRLAESKIKELTGNDKLTARFLHGEFFDFFPTFKLWLATNHKPVIRGSDRAIWDRIRLIPFTVRIAEENIDNNLKDKLIVEAPGILSWAVQGCLDWQRGGLREPEDVRVATTQYREEMDVLAGFIGDCCRVDDSESATAKELYTAYVKWCEENGEKPMSQQMLGRKFTDRGFDSDRLAGGVRAWLGIGLRQW